MSERGHKPASQYTNITDRMDNSFYSGAVNIGHLNLAIILAVDRRSTFNQPEITSGRSAIYLQYYYCFPEGLK